MDVPEFYEINDPSKLFAFLYYMGGNSFPGNESREEIMEVYMNMGPVRIRQMRTKQKECLGKSLQQCYYSEYNEDTRETRDIGDGSESWNKFRTAEENKINLVLNGKVGKYDGSGYVQDFYVPPTNRSIYHQVIRKYMSKESAYFSPAVRAIVMTTTTYYLSLDLWESVTIVNIYIYIYVVI